MPHHIAAAEVAVRHALHQAQHALGIDQTAGLLGWQIDLADIARDDGAAAKTGKRANGRVYKARKVPVSFTVEQELLTAFDARAAELGLSRAAAMALAMSRLVRGELIVRGDQ